MKILKKEIHKKENYFSLLIEDEKNEIKFWIDCSLIDGYGKHDDNGDYIDWEFNQYIFSNYSDEDARQKAYQEDGEKVEQLIYFIEEQEQDLVNWYKMARGGNNEAE
jgi:hypothetical protein